MPINEEFERANVDVLNSLINKHLKLVQVFNAVNMTANVSTESIKNNFTCYDASHTLRYKAQQ